MIHDRLLGHIESHNSQGETLPFKLCIVFFCIFALLSFFNLTHASPENALASPPDWWPGQRVRLKEDFIDIPAGTEGRIIELIKFPHLIALVRYKFQHNPALETNVLKLEAIPLSPFVASSSSSLDSVSKLGDVLQRSSLSEDYVPSVDDLWPFWKMIQRDPWYTTICCKGRDCDGEHVSGDAARAFKKIQDILQIDATRNHFPYTGVPSARADGYKYSRFIYTEFLRAHRARLWLISVQPDHDFLLEQFGMKFRIYQSWHWGFDLKYWTDSFISVDHICEPGYDPEEKSEDEIRWMASRGIQDDRRTIEIAKRRFGDLQSVSYNQIIQLLLSLRRGYELERLRREDPSRLTPARTLLFDNDSTPWLGKSAISIHRMLQYSPEELPFSLQIEYLDFLTH